MAESLQLGNFAVGVSPVGESSSVRPLMALLPAVADLAQRDACLNLLCEHLPALISIVDSAGKLVMASAQHAFLEGVASCPDDWRKVTDLYPASFQATLEGLMTLRYDPDTRVEFKARHKDGQFHVYQIRFLRQVADGGQPVLVLFGNDITAHKQVENSLLDHKSRLDYMVFHDNLTGLANRSMFYDRINKSLGTAKIANQTLGILLVDLDRFKNINESLGYDAGDDLLRITAENLRSQLRENDTVARLSGDEFVIVLENVNRRADIEVVAQKLLNRLALPVKLQGHQITTTASIGVSIFPADGETIDLLLKHADLAMNKAKNLGKNRFEFFEGAMSSNKAVNYLLLENDLRRAIEHNEICLHYQPQVNIVTGKIVGLEALARWHSKERGMVSPMHFIPLAEETGLIKPLGEWVLNHACERFQAWLMQGINLGKVAVNISPIQFRKEHFEQTVVQALMNSRLAPQYLELEITEGSAMEDAERAVEMLNCLSGLGVSLAIDDFGTGYSSLAYLKRFPIQKLKIDRSFVKDVETDTNDAAIAKSIIDLSHNMSLQVIAEGVEHLEQSNWLMAKGCHQVQGFYYSKPLSEEQLMAWINSSAVIRDTNGIRIPL